jgi:hypothetical protein
VSGQNAQNVAQHIFVKIKTVAVVKINLPQNFGYFCNFQDPARSKQLPDLVILNVFMYDMCKYSEILLSISRIKKKLALLIFFYLSGVKSALMWVGYGTFCGAFFALTLKCCKCFTSLLCLSGNVRRYDAMSNSKLPNVKLSNDILSKTKLLNNHFVNLVSYQIYKLSK